MWRNGPLHVSQKGKCETREELNWGRFLRTSRWPSLHSAAFLVLSHAANASGGGESSAAVQNLMPRVVIFDLISLPALLILLGEVRATPLVNLLNSAAFLKVCSGEISRTCYKGLTESTAQPTHFFQWFLALADLFTKASYMPASRLCLIWEGDVHNLLYMYCLKSEI